MKKTVNKDEFEKLKQINDVYMRKKQVEEARNKLYMPDKKPLLVYLNNLEDEFDKCKIIIQNKCDFVIKNVII